VAVSAAGQPGQQAALPADGVAGFFTRAARHAEIGLAIAIVGMVAMLILPLPEALLDLGLVVNLAVSVLILLTAVYTTQPLQFSVFPALLLITTLFRLSLEVSAMKLIIGSGSAGMVIATFGHAVIGDNYVVGILVFLLLVIVQFVVITAGAGRVAEVAARFRLDAMPGKQMAIDADLNAGVITQEQARERRRAVSEEADFYGAMDGGVKFVRGDAIAALVIIVLNIVGGFTVGLGKGDDVADVLQHYTLLTVGEGLVAQLPALLISVAAGLMVTRSSSAHGMGADVARQVFALPKPLFLAAGLICLFMPFGFPIAQTLFVAVVLGGLGYALTRAQSGMTPAVSDTAGAVRAPETAPIVSDSVLPLLAVEMLEVTFGAGLVNLVASGDLPARIKQIREKTALDLGLVQPTVSLRDNLRLPANGYAIKLKGVTVATGAVRPNSVLLIDSGTVTDPIEDGIPTREPTFGVPAVWVGKRQRERAEAAGYTVMEPVSVITSHLAEVIRGHAAEILTRQDTRTLVENVRRTDSAVVEELIPQLMSVGEAQKVLQHLLRERISIRDLVTILESLADNAPQTKDVDALGELVRIALSRSICRQYVDDESGVLNAITLDPVVEQSLIDHVGHGFSHLALEPAVARRLINALVRQVVHMLQLGHPQPILLCAAELRLPLRRLIERPLPQIVVLSYEEIAPEIEVRSVGAVTELGEE
jgi:flagellar biosynthesis protein FlhA